MSAVEDPDERREFIRARVRAIEAGLTADDVDKGCLLVELYLVSTKQEREELLRDMPAGMKEPFRDLIADVVRRFPPDGIA